jgi:hypothetical protein
VLYVVVVGWGALKAVPQEGWAQIALFTAALEVQAASKHYEKIHLQIMTKRQSSIP